MKLEKVFKRKYVLASKSPRRADLLSLLGLSFISNDSGVEEINDNIKPLDLIKYNALNKSRSVALNYKDEIVIGADTIVVLDKKILNKPDDEKQAVKYLKLLSGKEHSVYTGLNIIDTKTGKEIYGYERTKVKFRDLSNEEILYYVNTHKPLDKAGAYGIQDFGCLFIREIKGDFYNIVGLPLVKLYENLTAILA